MLPLNPNEGDPFGGTAGDEPPGRPLSWAGPRREVDRLETPDVAELLAFVEALSDQVHADRYGVALLIGARGCAALGQVPLGAASPVGVPECVAVVVERGAEPGSPEPLPAEAVVGEWTTSWSDAQHAAAVRTVQQAIGRGEVYQANVVGHRWAPLVGDPATLGSRLPAGRYRGSLSGEGWWVGCSSPEQLVRIEGDRITTIPIKGTARDRSALRDSVKDRAEHVMIVDLERNDLARITEDGSVVVEDLYALSEWSDLWHASSVVAGRLRAGTPMSEVLAAVLPGGSVTGAPKHAACGLLAQLEPVGRGPAMGALGFWSAEGLDLGLSIRTVAAWEGRVHLWAGGGITWSSDPSSEVAEAHAKAGPMLRALAQVRPSSS